MADKGSVKFRLQNLKVINILGRHFDFQYDAEEFYVAAAGEVRFPDVDPTDISDGTELWPRELAEHAAQQMARAYILENEQYAGGTDKFTGQTVMISGGQALSDDNILKKVNMILPENDETKVTTGPMTVGQQMKAKIEQQKVDEAKEFEDVLVTREDREGQLNQMILDDLRPIAAAHSVPGNLKKDDMVAEILRKEFE